jgi:hypothetical protein
MASLPHSSVRRLSDLAYRTLVGNDVDGPDHGYKIHLVYNATASPTERANNTMNDTIEPFNFSWRVVTKPSIFSGIKPTAHFVIDSRKTPNHLLRIIEDLIYGSPQNPAKQLTISELVTIFKDYDPDGWLIDAGWLGDSYLKTIDSGILRFEQTSSIYGGGV